MAAAGTRYREAAHAQQIRRTDRYWKADEMSSLGTVTLID
jgi:hypothetical protein